MALGLAISDELIIINLKDGGRAISRMDIGSLMAITVRPFQSSYAEYMSFPSGKYVHM